MNFMKSPLRYPGGKSKNVKSIFSAASEFKEYREPFLGGGSIFMYFKQRHPGRKYWVNDLYYELYNFWDVSQKDMNLLIEYIGRLEKRFEGRGKDMFDSLREGLVRCKDKPGGRVEKAAAFYVLNRISYSGLTEAGGYSDSSFKENLSNSSIERLKGLESILQNVMITNFDYQKVVEMDGEDVLILCDPPYFSATDSKLYGRNGSLHTDFDHIRFSRIMKSCKHKFLITYDDSPLIRDLFDWASIRPCDYSYVMKKDDVLGRELIISNYLEKIPETRQMKLLD